MISDSLVLTGRAVRVAVRSPFVVVSAALIPVLLMLLITAGMGRIVRPADGYSGYVDFSLPLFVLMGISFSTLTTATAAMADLDGGYDARLRTMPVAPAAPLVGRIAGDLIRNVGTLVLVLLVGLLLGFRFTTGPLAIVGFLLLPLVFGSGLAWFTLALAMRARSSEALVSALNAVFLLLSFFSTGMVAKTDLPGWAQPIAAANPLSVAVEAMRVLAHGGPTARPVAEALAWTVGLTLVFGRLAVTGYRQRRG
jgi:ABC transporter DrrB family efflux protein